jgi:hypothetical protein
MDSLNGEQANSENDHSEELTPLARIVHRKRQRKFVEVFAQKCKDGVPLEDAKIEAVRESYVAKQVVNKRSSALHKANELLTKKPWINVALDLLFSAQGLTPERAAKKQVKLVDSDDEKVSQSALNTYWDLTIPKPTARIQVQSLGVLEMITRNSNQKIVTRTLDGCEDENTEGSGRQGGSA